MLAQSNEELLSLLPRASLTLRASAAAVAAKRGALSQPMQEGHALANMVAKAAAR